MMCRTHGIRTTVVTAAAGGLVAMGLFAVAGCTRNERTTTARSAAQVAAASVTTAAGGQSAAAASRRSSGIKVDGHGGFDSSEAQQNVLKRAAYIQAHNNDVFKPYLPTTQPTSQLATGH